MTLPAPHIKDFCIRWLNPKLRLTTWNPWEKLVSDCTSLKEDWPVVADLIQRFDYSYEFVNTAYWKVVAGEVKRRAAGICQACGRQGRALEAHHTTYRNHGSEHLHMSELEAWCLVCHNLHHGQVVNAILAEHACKCRCPQSMTEALSGACLSLDGFSSVNDETPVEE
jgi:hypothetical protein